MAANPIDIDQSQRARDMLRPNRYRLDDRFVLRDGKRHPFAVVCPGGGYFMVCSFVEGVPLAKRLNDLGISVFIVYYRVRGKALYPAPQDDLARAVQEILENADHYRVEKAHYSIWGASAGGHLVASFGTDHMGYKHYGLPKPGALVLTYPVITLDPKLTHMGTRDNLLGKDAQKDREEFASVHLHVTADYPPTYIWCGDGDTTVLPENTRLMTAALEKAGVPHQCRIFPGLVHGIGLASDTCGAGWLEEAAAFWQNLRT